MLTAKFPHFGGDESSVLIFTSFVRQFPLFGGDEPSPGSRKNGLVAFPYFGGDEPKQQGIVNTLLEFPHFGGDGPQDKLTAGTGVSFPASAGMNRYDFNPFSEMGSFPASVGMDHRLAMPFAPASRFLTLVGMNHTSTGRRSARTRFPTSVGMDRCVTFKTWSSSCFPTSAGMIRAVRRRMRQQDCFLSSEGMNREALPPLSWSPAPLGLERKCLPHDRGDEPGGIASTVMESGFARTRKGSIFHTFPSRPLGWAGLYAARTPCRRRWGSSASVLKRGVVCHASLSTEKNAGAFVRRLDLEIRETELAVFVEVLFELVLALLFPLFERLDVVVLVFPDDIRAETVVPIGEGDFHDGIFREAVFDGIRDDPLAVSNKSGVFLQYIKKNGELSGIAVSFGMFFQGKQHFKVRSR